MKKILFLFSLSVLTLQANAQTYLVPNAQVQPAWVFPLWFEDGSGAKDTVYFCYDPDAGYVTDTLFGEKLLSVDPGKFTSYYESPLDNDTMRLKTVALQADILPYGITILFRNTFLPLTLRWDPQLFYSDSLPFPDLDPAPKAQGQIGFDLPMQTFGCSFDQLILLTDTITVQGLDCWRIDSLTFTGFGVDFLLFTVHPWLGVIQAIYQPESGDSMKVFPLPVSSNLNIVLMKGPYVKTSACLRNIQGVSIKNFDFDSNIMSVDLTDIPPGCYLLQVADQFKVLLQSLIIKI